MRTRRLPRPVIPIVFYLVVVVLWQTIGQAIAAPGTVLIPPSAIAQTAAEREAGLLNGALTTLGEAGAGFAIAAVVAIGLAVFVDRFRVAGATVYRLALVLYAVPVLAVAAPLVAFLGLGVASKITVAALAAYFPVLVNLTGALRTLDPRVEELGRVLAMGYGRRLWSLRAPAVLPALFSGFKIAGPAAFIGAILAEWMGAESGLGLMLLQAMFNFDVPLLWTSVIVATVLNGLIVLLIETLGRLAAPWHASAKGVMA